MSWIFAPDENRNVNRVSNRDLVKRDFVRTRI